VAARWYSCVGLKFGSELDKHRVIDTGKLVRGSYPRTLHSADRISLLASPTQSDSESVKIPRCLHFHDSNEPDSLLAACLRSASQHRIDATMMQL